MKISIKTFIRRLISISYIKFTDKHKEIANNIDLLSYLKSRGENIKKSEVSMNDKRTVVVE